MLRVACCLAVAAIAQAAGPLYQASIDQPQAFTVVRGSAVADSAVLHAGHKSLRIEPAASAPDAAVRFAPVSLTIGKRYELSGWVRTEDLHGARPRPLARSPSAPRSPWPPCPSTCIRPRSAAPQPWTRLTLRSSPAARRTRSCSPSATAARSAARPGSKASASTKSPQPDEWPVRDAVADLRPGLPLSVRRLDLPAHRGQALRARLPARPPDGARDSRIPRALRRRPRLARTGGTQYRTTANALFLRGFDREILEEMRGIADGASDAGAKWLNRRIDLIDIVVANITVELGELRCAMTIDAHRAGEACTFDKPAYADSKRDSVMDHCSAFAATGPATRDGKMVIGHVTWWPLTLAEQTNVMLDIKPAARPSHADAELSRRHRERHRLVSERCRRGADRDHHPPDALQHAGHAGGLPRPHGDSVRRQHRRSGGAAGHPQQRPLHQRMADRRRQEQRDRHVRAGHQPHQAVAQLEERMVRRHARASIGATTTPRTSRSAWNTIPIRRARPSTCPTSRRRATWPGRIFYQKYQGPDRRAVRIPGVPHRAAGERRAPWTPRSLPRTWRTA